MLPYLEFALIEIIRRDERIGAWRRASWNTSGSVNTSSIAKSE